jgi:ureidoacrylate peracid hydrolase
MQNGFCHPDGSLPRAGLALADVDRAVANTATAVERARHAGWPVVFTRHVYRAGYADAGANFTRVGEPIVAAGGLLAGSWDGDVIDELKCTAEDFVVDKARFDAFLQTSLELLLRGLGVQHLVFTGVVTNVCVESTVRAAFMRDFQVTLLGDCCAAKTARLHEIGLEVLDAYGFATVTSVSEYRF